MTTLYAAIMILLIFNEALFLWITMPPRRHPPSSGFAKRLRRDKSVTPQRRMLRR